MRRALLLLAALLLAASLAGCSGGGAKKSDGSLKQAEKAAQGLDVQATGTTGVIRGVVVDEALRPLGGANVSLQGGGGGNTLTNDQGAFAFDGLAPGTYYLTASKADYASVQQSVDVVAGVSNPPAIKLLLNSVPRPTPFIEEQSQTIFVDASVLAGGRGVTFGGLTSNNSYFFDTSVQTNGTRAQVELDWSATTPAGASADITCSTMYGSDAVEVQEAYLTSPAVFRLNATKGANTADNIACDIFAGNSVGGQVGVVAQQQFKAVIDVFHNFVPRDDWVFSRDGPYPVPA